MVESFYRVDGAPCIALLSDLHNTGFYDVLDSLRRRRPELICIAGDVVNRHKVWPGQGYVLPFLAGCAEIGPAYLSLGNHEWILEDFSELEESGVALLDNDFRTVMVGGRPVVIGGLTSGKVSRRETGTKAPRTGWLGSFAAARGFHVLLSHHPEYFPVIPEGIELTLSGHAHGGQWRVLGRGLFSPGQGLLPRYTSGVYDDGRKKMVVSRGLSNTTILPRLNNPTEIVYING